MGLGGGEGTYVVEYKIMRKDRKDVGPFGDARSVHRLKVTTRIQRKIGYSKLTLRTTHYAEHYQYKISRHQEQLLNALAHCNLHG